ncbi:putative type-1 pathogenesis-related protein [Chondromyces apiculatus DSM 436]|uniref:Putative type-1 pathogenesis-related protein n=2 Tax=Chondromyces apiculatus TaxID=51 RepID=A0A017T4F0_9BACT|nr:putative type-1 pathogenesis-related protein [Chondromyces apiculatus DSM 436]
MLAPGCSSDDGGNDGGDDSGDGNGDGTTTGNGETVWNGDTNGADEPANLEGITELHNAARATVSPPAATPIPPLVWSHDVASVAQAHAAKCTFEHSGNPYGENIYASSGNSTPDKVVGSWVSEKENYDYASNGCSDVCGHYTQVVWAASERLGCGMSACTDNGPFGDGPWEMWVCNYDPPGNFNGQKPY